MTIWINKKRPIRRIKIAAFLFENTEKYILYWNIIKNFNKLMQRQRVSVEIFFKL